jgi:phosphoglycolate phosphatase
MFAKPEAMIFDMDGTLFQTESLLIPAYHATFDEMRREGTFTDETPDEEIMIGCLGMLLPEIWRRVLPDADERVRQRADELFVKFALEYLEKGCGELYPEVADTLARLQASGIRLFVASNGLKDYVRGVARARGIAPLFEELYSAGEHQTPSKVDLVRLLLERHNLRDAWMVGDRSSDVEAGLKNNLTVIGCDYAGFGDGSELNGSHVRIRSFAELPQLFA